MPRAIFVCGYVDGCIRHCYWVWRWACHWFWQCWPSPSSPTPGGLTTVMDVGSASVAWGRWRPSVVWEPASATVSQACRAISVTSVCLDTGTWGLTDVRVRTGLADGGWADVFVCGGGVAGRVGGWWGTKCDQCFAWNLGPNGCQSKNGLGWWRVGRCVCVWGGGGREGGGGVMGHKVWPVFAWNLGPNGCQSKRGLGWRGGGGQMCLCVSGLCVWGGGAQSVTTVSLDTGTWGLMDDKVTAGLADGWEDALYFLGWGVGWGGRWIVKLQSVTSVCCIQTGTWGLVDVRVRGVCQMDGQMCVCVCVCGGGGCDETQSVASVCLDMEPGAQWMLEFGWWMGRCVCMLWRGLRGLGDGAQSVGVGVCVCVCVCGGGGDGAQSVTSVCMLREWNLGPYELWVRLRVGLFQKGEEWRGYMTMWVCSDLVFGGIIRLMCVFVMLTPRPPPSPPYPSLCVCVHVI